MDFHIAAHRWTHVTHITGVAYIMTMSTSWYAHTVSCSAVLRTYIRVHSPTNSTEYKHESTIATVNTSLGSPYPEWFSWNFAPTTTTATTVHFPQAKRFLKAWQQQPFLLPSLLWQIAERTVRVVRRSGVKSTVEGQNPQNVSFSFFSSSFFPFSAMPISCQAVKIGFLILSLLSSLLTWCLFAQTRCVIIYNIIIIMYFMMQKYVHFITLESAHERNGKYEALFTAHNTTRTMSYAKTVQKVKFVCKGP